ncbi:membrane transporter [Auriscalpium vulgare]|uniref:Membrane transporter n=1 Tax=Auriscalpium vulgare TaxID=40419 RepID=A0ACB8RHD9_9AGAM|nr:membrane transporter [Auriscalpium vulgare]
MDYLPRQESDESIVKEKIQTTEQRRHHTVQSNLAALDNVALFAAQADEDEEADPEASARVRRKVDIYLLPLMCCTSQSKLLDITMVNADKICLGESAIMGLMNTVHIDQAQFNWLGAAYYMSYLVFQYPQSRALQYFPVGKWMSFNVFLWSVTLLCHAACKSFASILAIRIMMGICEGAVIPGFMLIIPMFYTRSEQMLRIGVLLFMAGFSIILIGFVSFALLQSASSVLAPWQWLMIITGLLTLLWAVASWFLLPDSPKSAYFLTEKERLIAVKRIIVNQAGVENKHFKKEQFIEVLRDPKTWLFFASVGAISMTNSLTNQRQLIVKQFGFTPIQSTLIGCVDGVVTITVLCAGAALSSLRFGRSGAALATVLPGITGCALVILLPDSDRVGLLFSYWTAFFTIVPYALTLSWVMVVTAGHTKKTTTNAIVMIAYALGSALGPFMWKAEYQPRNRVPWITLGATALFSSLITLTLRLYLARENARRDREAPDTRFDAVYVRAADGGEKRVDKAYLDLTDWQNREFRYPL